MKNHDENWYNFIINFKPPQLITAFFSYGYFTNPSTNSPRPPGGGWETILPIPQAHESLYYNVLVLCWAGRNHVRVRAPKGANLAAVRARSADRRAAGRANVNGMAATSVTRSATRTRRIAIAQKTSSRRTSNFLLALLLRTWTPEVLASAQIEHLAALYSSAPLRAAFSNYSTLLYSRCLSISFFTYYLIYVCRSATVMNVRFVTLPSVAIIIDYLNNMLIHNQNLCMLIQ